MVRCGSGVVRVWCAVGVVCVGCGVDREWCGFGVV